MTALCSGGPSGPKPAFGQFIYVGPAALGALLNNVPTPWAVAFAAAIGAITYDLSVYCTTDPPATPTLTAQDFFDLIQIAPLTPAYIVAQQKLQTWVASLVWWQFCQCTSVTTPAPPTPPSAPSGLPQVNPTTGPFVSPATPCYTYTSPEFQMVSVFGTGNKPTTLGDPHTQAGAAPWPPGVTYIDLIVTRTSFGATHDSADVTFRVTDNPAFTAGTNSKLISAVPVGTTTYNILGGPQSIGPRWGWFIDTFSDSTPSTITTDKFRYTVNAYCGGQTPSAGPAPCCPPDPTLQFQVDQILEYVKLIQRQAVPFAYVPGTVHTGLSGSGVLSISGLLGAKVNLTTIPAHLGRTGTAPTELFEAGFITWGTADGYPQSVRLEHAQQISLPSRCSAFTDLAYDLAPGVVATITELKRES